MKSLVLSAVLVAGIAANAARAEVIENFEAEDWSGLAYADDNSGAFHNCIVFAGYPSGATLMLIRTVENDWSVAIAHDDWQLTPGNSYPLRYKIDRRRAVQSAADALVANQLTIAGDDRLIDQIGRGRLLTVTFDGTDYAFELSNSAKALKAAQDCVDRHRGRVVQQTAAPADSTEPPAAPEAPPAGPGQAAAAAEVAEPEAAQPGALAETSDASTLGEQQSIGHWVVTATDDGAGNFVNCTAFGVEHGYDDQLILSYTPQGKWEFGLYRSDWSLATDGSYTLWYNVDASVDEPGVMKRPVEAVEPTRIFFEVSSLETLIERAATGRQLNLQLRGVGMEPEDVSYSLDRAGEALDAAKTCVVEHLARSVTVDADVEAETGADAVESIQIDPPSQPEQLSAGMSSLVPASSDEPIETFEVPGWNAAAWADKTTGSFAYCSIRAEYQNGTTLGFLRKADDSLVVTLHRSDWSLQPGEGMPIKYQVTWDSAPNAIGITGGGLERYGEAQAVDASMLAVEIGNDERFMERLSQPKRLNVEVQGQSLVFDIGDLPPGLEAIDDCRQRHLSTAQAQAEPQQQAADGPSLPPIGEEKVETLDVPGWDGGAYADAAGTFTHCGISAEYQNGAVLAFARTADNSLLLALARSDWTLEPKEWSPIRYSFGKDFPINNEGEAQAVNATILATNMGRDDLFTDQLKQSPRLSVEARGHSLSFDISDLAPGLEAIADCRERHLVPAAAPSGKAAAAPAAEETAAEEGARYVTDLLVRSGYPDLHMLVGDDRPSGFQNYDAVWEIGEILGMLTIQPQTEGLSLTQMRNKIISDDAATCEGEFSTGTLASQGSASVHLYSACKTAESEFSVYYGIVPRPRGGYYVVMHIGLGDGAAARAISTKVHETAL